MIITVPHPTLRAKATTVTAATPQLTALIAELTENLLSSKRPGVGLAAPQINQTARVFITYMGTEEGATTPRKIRVFVNPEIRTVKGKQSFGPDPEQPIMEGCLSIPTIWGIVPRYTQIKVEFDELLGERLVRRVEEFAEFPARVFQHELDHLDGILFTDYSLEYDLPLYQENPKTKKWEELTDRQLIQTLTQ
jgi:peptide deformylase